MVVSVFLVRFIRYEINFYERRLLIRTCSFKTHFDELNLAELY